MKKYEFTGETIRLDGRTLKQIKRLSDGLIGGYIESEDNLSHNGSCFVYDNACVFGDARVHDSARVSGDAGVSGNASVHGNASISENAYVSDNAWIYGDAHVADNARVYGYARVSGNAIATDKVITSNAHKYHITITDNYINIGCENHLIDYWKKNINEIAKKHNYTTKELKNLKLLLNGLFRQRKW